MADYDRESFALALTRADVHKGSVVFTVSNIGFFGKPPDDQDPCVVIMNAFEDVLGPKGTLVVPTFTYSFCKGEDFDPLTTPSNCGMFAEWLRCRPGTHRSEDPIFSVAAVGGRAEELTTDVGDECFGLNSFWGRFYRANGIICNMNFDAGSTFLHYAERYFNAPHRYDKLFTGTVIKDGHGIKKGVVFYCRDPAEDSEIDTAGFTAVAEDEGKVKKVPVGRGMLTAIRAKACFSLIERHVQAAAPDWMPTPRYAPKPPELPEEASPNEIVDALAPLERDLVSNGYDDALAALARQIPITIHRYPTGKNVFTWIVPEKWSCSEAYLEADGERIIDMKNHPLHVVRYSLPFEGTVDRDELLRHLHTSQRSLHDRIPFVFKYYDRDWGLCCSETTFDKIARSKRDEYKVLIRSKFSRGELKVGEVEAVGRSGMDFVLCAHLDHACQANDGLSGVAVGIEVMRRLRARDDLRYTYKLLILPETIGSAAWLAEQRISGTSDIAGGIFLEMLGTGLEPRLQLSLKGETELDECLKSMFVKNRSQPDRVHPYRKLICNDERQFNAAGNRIPMLSLACCKSPHLVPWVPFNGYHTNQDSSCEDLAPLVDRVLFMIDRIENNVVPAACHTGEICYSRFGLFGDREKLDAICDRMDGHKSVAAIASETGLSFDEVKALLDKLEAHELVGYEEPW